MADAVNAMLGRVEVRSAVMPHHLACGLLLQDYTRPQEAHQKQPGKPAPQQQWHVPRALGETPGLWEAPEETAAATAAGGGGHGRQGGRDSPNSLQGLAREEDEEGSLGLPFGGYGSNVKAGGGDKQVLGAGGGGNDGDGGVRGGKGADSRAWGAGRSIAARNPPARPVVAALAAGVGQEEGPVLVGGSSSSSRRKAAVAGPAGKAQVKGGMLAGAMNRFVKPVGAGQLAAASGDCARGGNLQSTPSSAAGTTAVAVAGVGGGGGYVGVRGGVVSTVGLMADIQRAVQHSRRPGAAEGAGEVIVLSDSPPDSPAAGPVQHVRDMVGQAGRRAEGRQGQGDVGAGDVWVADEVEEECLEEPLPLAQRLKVGGRGLVTERTQGALQQHQQQQQQGRQCQRKHVGQHPSDDDSMEGEGQKEDGLVKLRGAQSKLCQQQQQQQQRPQQRQQLLRRLIDDDDDDGDSEQGLGAAGGTPHGTASSRQQQQQQGSHGPQHEGHVDIHQDCVASPAAGGGEGSPGGQCQRQWEDCEEAAVDDGEAVEGSPAKRTCTPDAKQRMMREQGLGGEGKDSVGGRQHVTAAIGAGGGGGRAGAASDTSSGGLPGWMTQQYLELAGEAVGGVGGEKGVGGLAAHAADAGRVHAAREGEGGGSKGPRRLFGEAGIETRARGGGETAAAGAGGGMERGERGMMELGTGYVEGINHRGAAVAADDEGSDGVIDLT